MPYIIRKKSRCEASPYAGPTCEAAGVPSFKLYHSLDEATADAQKLGKCNPVGFDVVRVKLVEEA